MNPGLEPKHLNLDEEEMKCFRYLCTELDISISQRVRDLIKQDLQNNELLIITAMDKQKQKIINRRKE